jgi:exo-1,4-beta-D-glucosaminidase
MNESEGKYNRIFQVNGKNIVIRGGGYVDDMMMRLSKENEKAAVKYAKHMNLNTLRMEAPHGSDYLYNLCDEEGILVMVGWCCCSTWEQWDKWNPHIAHVAEESWKDQIIRLRNHPSVFTWLYGSDLHPPEDVEKN